MATSIARSVVRESLRVKENEPVMISAAEQTIDLATEVALECFKAGADPAILYENDDFFYGQYKFLTEDQLRTPSGHCLGIAEYARSYVWLSGAKNPAGMAKVPKSKWSAAFEGEEAHHEKSLEKKPKQVFVGLSLVTRERAKTYGFNYAAWKKNVEDGIKVNYPAMKKMAETVRGLLLVPHHVRITADNGTDLRFKLAGASRRVDVSDGVISDEDIASGNTGTGLPAGDVTVAPIETSANGTFVSDVNIPSVGTLIERLSFAFKDGKITDFTAKRNLANAQLNYAEASGAKDMFGTFTLGVNPKAKPGFLYNSVPKGVVSIGIGDNRDVGGVNASSYGFGAQHSLATVDLDGKRIIEAGQFVI